MSKQVGVLFDERFLDRHAGALLSDTGVAIVELTANAWDAYTRGHGSDAVLRPPPSGLKPASLSHGARTRNFQHCIWKYQDFAVWRIISGRWRAVGESPRHPTGAVAGLKLPGHIKTYS